MTVFKFILAMFLSFLPGILGVMVAPISAGENAWYNTLNNSIYTPAGWVFSAVWTLLYFFIGLALFLIMQKHQVINHHDKVSAYTLFAVNIILNLMWSYVFFGAQMPELALVTLSALLVIAIFMARAFFRISVPAFWLVLPYVVWLMFSFYLNATIVYLN